MTSSGTPIVSIATPREDGASYNVFSKLNVGKEGLMFSNRKEIGKSQIGRQILANSRLRGSDEASLILTKSRAVRVQTYAGLWKYLVGALFDEEIEVLLGNAPSTESRQNYGHVMCLCLILREQLFGW
jgi:hypothetical protein